MVCKNSGGRGSRRDTRETVRVTTHGYDERCHRLAGNCETTTALEAGVERAEALCHS